jgi:hypothetical protein
MSNQKNAPSRLAGGSLDLLGGAKASNYIGHTLGMLTSFAWRGLPDDARRVLDRLEVEHLRRHLKDNGKLLCTYDQFVEAGVRRAAIRLAIEQAVALGFLEIVRRGYAARMEVHVPSTYRLTYVKSFMDAPASTDEWRKFSTKQQVCEALKHVLAELEAERETRRARRRNEFSPGHERSVRAL